MKQVIPFKKDIIFKTKISDITSISLEHTLTIDDDMISGDFILSGDYKMTEASINKEDFYYKLPFDIALDSRYETKNLKIEIDDFYYEIINSDVLRVNIEVSLDGLEEKDFSFDEDSEEDNSILDIDINEEKNNLEELEKHIDILQEELVRNHEHINKLNEQITNMEEEMESMPIPVETNQSIPVNIQFEEKVNSNMNEEAINIDTKEIKSLFSNLSDEETFSTYHVYILRSDDTIESVMAKYNVTREVLMQYNDVDNLKLGDKIIIPALVND
ncbi:MAG: LysM peptidoglycan-binding domain-containing protein [Bacilli bacterium]|nr:LysM peptidoglycan-binding domain-containing protein [Bacilli bacterium]